MKAVVIETILKPSNYLSRPEKGNLVSFDGNFLANSNNRNIEISNSIKNLLNNKNYPCIAALQSFRTDDYYVGTYGKLGEGKFWRDLRNDLIFFLQSQTRTTSTYLTFWAIFEPNQYSEDAFEDSLWKELSFLTSVEDRQTDWKTNSTQDPQKENFRFSLGGSDFFVVGLHPDSSRISRRFPYPALVFNVFAQFEHLQKIGQYDKMVKINRDRDIKYQGDVNPMVEKHGEIWESIQFSGKNNSSKWKCPFHFFHKSEKP